MENSKRQRGHYWNYKGCQAIFAEMLLKNKRGKIEQKDGMFSEKEGSEKCMGKVVDRAMDLLLL